MKAITKIALGVLATSIALLIILPSNPPAAKAESPSAATGTSAKSAPANSMNLDCDLAAERAREFIAGRDKGQPEGWALALLRGRGELSFGFVVDGVYHGPPSTPAAITVADVVSACNRVIESGSVY